MKQKARLSAWQLSRLSTTVSDYPLLSDVFD